MSPLRECAIALLVLQLNTVLASNSAPRVNAAITTCKPTTTTANFDTLPTGKNPPHGYGGALFGDSWIVESAKSAHLVSKTSSNVLFTRPSGEYEAIPYMYGTKNPFQLHSFYFACTKSINGKITPTACNLTLFYEECCTLPSAYDFPSYGPVLYEPSAKVPAKMTQFILPKNVSGQQVEFSAWDAGTGSAVNLYIDDMIMISPYCG